MQPSIRYMLRNRLCCHQEAYLQSADSAVLWQHPRRYNHFSMGSANMLRLFRQNNVKPEDCQVLPLHSLRQRICNIHSSPQAARSAPSAMPKIYHFRSLYNTHARLNSIVRFLRTLPGQQIMEAHPLYSYKVQCQHAQLLPHL